MRRVVVAMLAFSLVWVLPAPAASAATATGLYPVVLDDLSPHVAGRPVEVSAVLLADDAPLVGQVLTVSVMSYGSTTFVPVGTATTGFDGIATTRLTLDRSAAVRWSFESDGSYDASSTEFQVPVGPRVDLRANHRSLHRGQRLVVRGRTFPAKPGCTVRLWRGELRPLVQGPKPVRLAVSKVRADGRFRLVHRFHARGRMRVAVTVGACAGNDRGLSSYLRVRVR
jgi:hypothetical protein